MIRIYVKWHRYYPPPTLPDELSSASVSFADEVVYHKNPQSLLQHSFIYHQWQWQNDEIVPIVNVIDEVYQYQVNRVSDVYNNPVQFHTDELSFINVQEEYDFRLVRIHDEYIIPKLLDTEDLPQQQNVLDEEYYSVAAPWNEPYRLNTIIHNDELPSPIPISEEYHFTVNIWRDSYNTNIILDTEELPFEQNVVDEQYSFIIKQWDNDYVIIKNYSQDELPEFILIDEEYSFVVTPWSSVYSTTKVISDDELAPLTFGLDELYWHKFLYNVSEYKNLVLFDDQQLPFAAITVDEEYWFRFLRSDVRYNNLILFDNDQLPFAVISIDEIYNFQPYTLYDSYKRSPLYYQDEYPTPPVPIGVESDPWSRPIVWPTKQPQIISFTDEWVPFQALFLYIVEMNILPSINGTVQLVATLQGGATAVTVYQASIGTMEEIP